MKTERESYWRPRVMRHRKTEGDEEYAIHEVYFDGNGQVTGYTQDAVSPRAESVDALKKTLRALLEGSEDTMALGDRGHIHHRDDVELWLTHMHDEPLEYEQVGAVRLDSNTMRNAKDIGSPDPIKRIEARMRPEIPTSIQIACGVGRIGENESLQEAHEREDLALQRALGDIHHPSEDPRRRIAIRGQSKLGFLNDGQDLMEVIERDRRTLERFRIHPKQIADRLETIVGKALRMETLCLRGHIALTEQQMDALANGTAGGVLVEDRFLFSAIHWRGLQECPFETKGEHLCSDTSYSDLDCLVKNVNNGVRVFFPGLIIHLIREHGFFEGSLKYRVEPEEIITLLELEPGRDYAPEFREETVWQICGGQAVPPHRFDWGGQEEWKSIVDAPEKTLELGEKARLFRVGDRCVVVAEESIEVPDSFSVGDIAWGEKRTRKGVSFYMPYTGTYVPL